jgi:hypothetical protein
MGNQQISPLDGWIRNFLVLYALPEFKHWLPRCKTKSRRTVMLFRTYFLHYRLIREAITAVATVGAALLFSYLILQA